jgi:hypothetical protein
MSLLHEGYKYLQLTGQEVPVLMPEAGLQMDQLACKEAMD